LHPVRTSTTFLPLNLSLFFRRAATGRAAAPSISMKCLNRILRIASFISSSLTSMKSLTYFLQMSKVIEERFREWVPSRRRDVDRLGPIQLNGLAARIGELLIEGDSRENLFEVLSRVGPTRFDPEV